MWFRALASAAVLLSLTSTAHAQDAEFTWQGRILDAAGGSVNGEVVVVASLYEGEFASTPVWTDTFTVTPEDGYLSLDLGSVATLTPDVMARDRLWVGLQLGVNGPLLGERQRMRAVPYATVAGGVRVIDVSPVATDCEGQTGQLVFDTEAGGLFVCDGAEWVPAGNGSPYSGPSIHNTVTFTPSGTAGGCSYQGTNATPFVNLGNMPWKQCMAAASERGAMVVSNQYTVVGGWAPHRNGSNAMWSNWSSYQQANITTSRACVVGIDPRDSSTRNTSLNSSTTFDGDTWQYQDYGTKYYDECQLLASQAGASIITPGTIGLGTGDGYFVPSVHTCNTFEWVTASGAGYTYETQSSGQRSTQHQCMIGYLQTTQQ